MKKITTIFILFTFLQIDILFAQSVLIPDSNFEQALIDLGMDENLDGLVLAANIEEVTNLFIINRNISNLTGIEGFVALKVLYCSYNNLTSIDLSQNDSLTTLDCSSNELTALSLSENPRLEILNCSSNQLTTINISSNLKLKIVDLSGNKLTNLDLSQINSLTQLSISSNYIQIIDLTSLDSLELLNCSNNRLTALNIDNNAFLKTLFCASNELEELIIATKDSLEILDCSNNQLSNLNVDYAPLLNYLTCSSNQIRQINLVNNDSLIFVDIANNNLTELDVSNKDSLINLIVSRNKIRNIVLNNNRIIQTLDFSDNLIRSLDFSNDTSLRSIDCSNNQLISLHINNGRNRILNRFNATGNHFLRCIEVDDPIFSENNVEWLKDTTATYQTECLAYTFIPDDNFEAELIAQHIDNGPLDDYVLTSDIINITTLDIDSLNITDITGIEDFVNLQVLDCSHNQLFNLDISNLQHLISLDCSADSLVDLNLRNGVNPILINMNATNNPKLECIRVDNAVTAGSFADWFKDNAADYNEECTSGKTYIPDDNFERALIRLGFDKGSPDNYVFTDSIDHVTNLDISGQNIFNLNGIGAFVELDTLNCSENNLDSIDVSTNDKLLFLNCSGNYLTVLDIQNDTLLTTLSCGDNKLTALDVTKNTQLKQLNFNLNYIKAIDFAADTNLLELNCNSNLISNLDLSNNTKLEKLFCAKNKIETLQIYRNDSLKELDCTDNLLSQLNLDSISNLLRFNCSVNFINSLDLSSNAFIQEVKCNSNDLNTLIIDQNRSLRKLNCSNNKLSGLNLANNDSLRQLIAANNGLTGLLTGNLLFIDSIDVSDNKISNLSFTNNNLLQYLICSNNQLDNLNVNSNPILQTLKCDNNQLNTLDISQNNLLIELDCSNNLINEINLINAPDLEILNVNTNLLTNLDLSPNTSLINISCANNNISTLDFSNLTSLTSMNCSSNQLTSLYGRNGHNQVLETFYSANNPELRCIEIDNITFIGNSWIKDATATYAESCHYSDTYIPDDNFEAALSLIIGEAFNNNDDYIPTSSIDTITTLIVDNQNITDLTGIQDFTALITFNCSANSLDSLILDALPNLTTLNCSNNQLNKLDLSSNPLLEVLDFSMNAMDTIDLSNLIALTSLAGNNNNMISLNLESNVNLTSINLASNQLINLQVNNGNNGVLASFNATNNPALFCIEVDDPSLANSGSGIYSSWLADEIVTYGDNCHYNETYIPDDAFEQALMDMGYDPAGPLDDYVPTAALEKIAYLNIANKGIADLTGLEDFIALVTLNCSNNQLSSLDISQNLTLVTLICASNHLSSLNISMNTNLHRLDITGNELTSLDLSGNTGLERLLCSLNFLQHLNILNNTALIEVNCSSNQLMGVDANNGYNSVLQYFDLRNNPDLRCILVDDIIAATGYSGWHKDPTAGYKLECNDDDNDGVIDAEDLCPDTPFGDLVDVFGCSLFILPSDNFVILTKSETCRDGNNGIVNISAAALYNYTATLIGTLDTVVFKFTNTADIRNLRADRYSLWITIDDEPAYAQYYEVLITQPDNLIVQSEIDQSGDKVTLKMSGGTRYTIDFNGLKFNTEENEIVLYLEKGKNTVQIMANEACQGIYNETFIYSDEPFAFPNPFNTSIDLFVGQNIAKEVDVKIFSHNGQLILSNKYQTQNGTVHILTAGFRPGIYYVWMKTEIIVSTIKIVKE